LIDPVHHFVEENASYRLEGVECGSSGHRPLLRYLACKSATALLKGSSTHHDKFL
jgi:hypothetical protein